MMYKFAILCVLAVSAFGEEEVVSPDGKGRTTNSNKYSKQGPAKRYRPMEMKGPCEQTMECRANTFEAGDKAPCLGYYSCFKAQFMTDETIKCMGSAACQKATFYGASSKVICSGYRSCEATISSGNAVADLDMTPGLWSADFISCDGPFACNTIRGGVYGARIKCDGDAACSNIKGVAAKAAIAAKKAGTLVVDDPAMLKLVATADITCNGKSTCREDIMYAGNSVMCDGDGACRKSLISAPAVECHGKRSCEAVSPMFTSSLEAYGFMGAAGAKIVTADRDQDLVINAYGFNTLKNAEIAVRGGKLTLNAFGWRSAFGAKVYCSRGSCQISCYSTGCLKMVVYYKDVDAEVTMEPAACHPSSGDFPGMAGKAQGVNCPTFEALNSVLDLSAYGTPEDMLKESYVVPTKSVFPAYPESLRAEMAESAMEDAAFNAAEDQAMDEYLTALMTDLDADLEEHLEEAETFNTQNTLFDGLMTVQSLQQTTASSGLIISNIITAFVVFAMFAAVSYYYPQCHLAKKSELSPLLP